MKNENFFLKKNKIKKCNNEKWKFILEKKPKLKNVKMKNENFFPKKSYEKSKETKFTSSCKTFK